MVMSNASILFETPPNNLAYDQDRHSEILQMLKYSARSFGLEIPKHWL